MKTPNLQIELHLLQNFVPSCLNRDDTNTPKDCTFGDVRRARISSQCFKRAIRQHFKDTNSTTFAERTKKIKRAIAAKLTDTGLEAAQLAAAVDLFVTAYYAGADSKKPEETSVLLYIAEAEITEAATIIRELLADESDTGLKALALARVAPAPDGAKKAKKEKGEKDAGALTKESTIENRLKNTRLSADISLFGRMLAEQPDKNVDAAAQVAHALSTHATDLELDFWTAVDDLNSRADTGAGMLGVQGFNSACYYRYMLVDFGQLQTNLGGDTETATQALRAFLEAAILAIPIGKQNAMAAQNLPLFGLVVVRDGGVPISLANAFVKPVRVDGKGLGDDDLVAASVDALTKFYGRVKTVYGTDGIRKESLFHLTDEGRLNDLASADAGSVKIMIDAAINALKDASQA